MAFILQSKKIFSSFTRWYLCGKQKIYNFIPCFSGMFHPDMISFLVHERNNIHILVKIKDRRTTQCF